MKSYIQELFETQIGIEQPEPNRAWVVIDHGRHADAYPVDLSRIRGLKRGWIERRDLDVLIANLGATDRRGIADAALLVFARVLAGSHGELAALQNRELVPVAVIGMGAVEWHGVECRAVMH